MEDLSFYCLLLSLLIIPLSFIQNSTLHKILGIAVKINTYTKEEQGIKFPSKPNKFSAIQFLVDMTHPVYTELLSVQ